MIAIFPKIYEDELAYSIFARYHIYSGHITFRATAEDLFANKDVIPSPEFIVALTNDARQMITQELPFEVFLEKHTLLPYYTRFLPLERRRKAFHLLMAMDRTFYDALYMRKNKTARRRYMRYCPLCAASDRAQYGETYWHRKHQLTGIDICLEHRCRLDETDIEIAAEKHRYKLVAAETAVPYATQANMKITVQEQKVAAYVLRIFEADLDYTSDIPIGRFLHAKLEGTPYTSLRGEQVFARKLFDQISREYATLPQFTLEAWWYVQKVFCAQNFHTYDICLIALFLGIPADDLLNLELPELTLQQRFDLKLQSLREKGMTQKQAAQAMGVSIHAVKGVEEKRRHRTPYSAT